jgi:hypothetical protein
LASGHDLGPVSQAQELEEDHELAEEAEVNENSGE